MKKVNNFPTVKTDLFDNYFTIGDLRKQVLNWCKLNLSGMKIFNQSFGKYIELTWQGLKNDISESCENYTDKLYSFTVLDKIIENADYIGFVDDKLKRPDIKKVHYFKSEVIVRNVIYDVNIVVFEVNKTFIYAHTLSLK